MNAELNAFERRKVHQASGSASAASTAHSFLSMPAICTNVTKVLSQLSCSVPTVAITDSCYDRVADLARRRVYGGLRRLSLHLAQAA